MRSVCVVWVVGDGDEEDVAGLACFRNVCLRFSLPSIAADNLRVEPWCCRNCCIGAKSES